MAMPVVVTGCRVESMGPGHRVSAVVDGATLSFSCDEEPLRPSAEAFAGLVLAPALATGRDLRVEAEVSPLWLKNVRLLAEAYRSWWGFPRTVITADGTAPPAPNHGREVLLFSGGVDAFHTLLTASYTWTDLVGIRGMAANFDTPGREEGHRACGRAAAEAVGARFVLLRTDAGRHPLFANHPLRYTVGGLLASAGHLLSGTGRLVISSSFPPSTGVRWSSSWDTDHLWGTESMKVVHFGGEATRRQKVAAVADNILFRNRLSVCFNNTEDFSNCCRCEKCVRSMLALAAEGKLDGFPSFAGRGALAAAVASIPHLPEHMFHEYDDLLGHRLEPRVESEVRALLRRSRFRANPMVRWAREAERRIRTKFRSAPGKRSRENPPDRQSGGER